MCVFIFIFLDKRFFENIGKKMKKQFLCDALFILIFEKKRKLIY
jgi:hypothetical protein